MVASPFLLLNLGLIVIAFAGVILIAGKLKSSAARRTFIVFAVPLAWVVLAILFGNPEQRPATDKIHEARFLANPHLTGAGIACSENALRPGLDHEALGLSPSTSYSGPYTESVSTQIAEKDKAEVTVTLKEIHVCNGFLFYFPGICLKHTLLEPGKTIVIEGQCGVGGMRWTVSPDSTLRRNFWPKF